VRVREHRAAGGAAQPGEGRRPRARPAPRDRAHALRPPGRRVPRRDAATAGGAYEVAFKRASTVEGQCAVYTRVLREIGELYAARQRLGVDAELEMSFSIEGAIGVYATL